MTTGTDSETGGSTGVTKMPSIAPLQHIPYLDHNYGQPPPMTPPDSNSPPEDCDTGNEDEEDDGVTRCICDFSHDDGYMICCDKCSVWQHIECMGIQSDAVPENYLCELCNPRQLDVDRAKAIQAKKKEELSDDDDEEDESDGEPRDVTSYTAVSNTPTRITLTARVNRTKRSRSVSKSKVENHEEKKQKRRRRPKQKACPEFSPHVDENTNEAWVLTYDNYQEIKENLYSEQVLGLDTSHDQVSCGSFTGDADKQFCKVAEVQRNKKGIVAAEDMNRNQFIIQVKGKITSQSHFEEENPFFKRSSLYVLYYSKFDRMQLCIDARTCGNDARFVRRSCSPNAELRHFVRNSNICFGIFSTTPLPKGVEVTIPFEFIYSDYECPLPCACAQDTCVVAKFNSGLPVGDKKRVKSIGEDSNSGLHKMSPLRDGLSGNHSAQGDSDSDQENNPDKSLESSNGHKIKSREDRKFEALLKQIDRMERKENKRKQQTGTTPKESRYPDLKVVHEECTTDSKQTPKAVTKNNRRKAMKRGMGFGAQGVRRKRVRMTSGSSEPQSPDEHSSAASTPTTPVHGAALAAEPGSGAPCTSPSRNFKFQRVRQSSEEESRDDALKVMSRSEGELSVGSSPVSLSPSSTPRADEFADTRLVLSAASSTNDLTTVEEEEAEGEGEGEREEEEVAVLDETPVRMDVGPARPDPAAAAAETSDVKALGQSLTTRLTEISSARSSEVSSPSPCPSTSGSPTSAESVTSVCGGVVLPERSPGPAPGSPVAKLMLGPRNSSTNPFYGSLKKRWLLQFLYGQNVANGKPPNGFRTNANASILGNGTETSVISSKGNCRRKLAEDCIPPKKRYLKKFQEFCLGVDGSVSAKVSDADTNKASEESPSRAAPAVTPPVNASPEQPKATSTPDGQLDRTPSEQSTAASQEQPCADEPAEQQDSILTGSSSQPVVLRELMSNTATEKERTSSVLEVSAADVPPPRRPSDPRLSGCSASLGAGSAAAASASPSTATNTSTAALTTGVTQAPGSDVQTGTPGKKKVSLLEYRNRSRQRLSGDAPKAAPAPANQPASVIRSAASSVQSSAPAAPRVPAGSPTTNGPSVEPVSPDGDDKAHAGHSRSQASKNHTSLAAGTISIHDPDNRLSKELRKKKQMIAKKEEGMAKLTSFISGQLLKESRSPLLPTLGRSPSSNSSGSPSAPPPPPPPETSGDAMEIEDDDSSVGTKIYVTPAPLPTPHPSLQPALRSQFMPAPSHLQQQQPDFRMSVPQPRNLAHAQLMVAPGPIQVQQRIPPSSSGFLVTSPPGVSTVRFPPGYQGHQSQPTGFFPS